MQDTDLISLTNVIRAAMLGFALGHQGIRSELGALSLTPMESEELAQAVAVAVANAWSTPYQSRAEEGL